MKLLLDEQYAPITSSPGFIEASYPRTVEAFQQWHEDLIRGSTETIDKREIMGPLAHALNAVLPLTIPVRLRFLFVPTASAWTAYFDNLYLGTDAVGPMSVLALRLKCRSLRIDATPDSMGTKSLYDKTKRGRYGGSSFELYGPEPGQWGNTIRAIYAVNDSRWTFDAFGTPQPFEEPEHYTARRIKDRFPFELLDKYCRALGVRPFDEDFYLPPEQPTATLIERIRPPDPKVKEFTLAEVQAEWK